MTTFKKEPTNSPRMAQPTTRYTSTFLDLTFGAHSAERYIPLSNEVRVYSINGAVNLMLLANDRNRPPPMTEGRTID
jgi:hypothetical protein